MILKLTMRGLCFLQLDYETLVITSRFERVILCAGAMLVFSVSFQFNLMARPKPLVISFWLWLFLFLHHPLIEYPSWVCSFIRDRQPVPLYETLQYSVVRNKTPIMAVLSRVAHSRIRFRNWYTELVSTEFGRKSLRLGIYAAIGFPLFFLSFHRLPSGHIAVIQTMFGT